MAVANGAACPARVLASPPDRSFAVRLAAKPALLLAPSPQKKRHPEGRRPYRWPGRGTPRRPYLSRCATPARSSSSSARVLSMYFLLKSSIGRSLTMVYLPFSVVTGKPKITPSGMP